MRSRQANAASAIRKELKQEFPNIKFRVTSDAGSLSSAVRVESVEPQHHGDRHLHRALYDDVRAVVNKYEYGKHDPMTDFYNYDNRRDDIPQVTYVLVQV